MLYSRSGGIRVLFAGQDFDPTPETKMHRLLVVVLLALSANGATGITEDWKRRRSAEKRVVEWVESNGGTVRFRLGRACSTCIRGAVASQDLPSPGMLILNVSQPAMVRLPDLGHDGTAAEYARHLVHRMHLDPTFNDTYGSYIQCLPLPDELFMWEQRHIDALRPHTPEVAKLAEHAWVSTERVYQGHCLDGPCAPMKELMGSKVVPLSTFHYVQNLIRSRYFGVDEHTGTGRKSYFLVPLLDAANHADRAEGTALNAFQTERSGSLQLKALRPIKKGEEIRINYQPGIIHRNDLSLLLYGFIQKRERPLLLATDLPTYDPFNHPAGQATEETDSVYYGPRGQFNTEEERKRLYALLAQAPTTEAEDAKLLGSGELADWRDRLVVEFRVERKKALRLAIQAIDEQLRQQRGEPTRVEL